MFTVAKFSVWHERMSNSLSANLGWSHPETGVRKGWRVLAWVHLIWVKNYKDLFNRYITSGCVLWCLLNWNQCVFAELAQSSRNKSDIQYDIINNSRDKIVVWDQTEMTTGVDITALLQNVLVYSVDRNIWRFRVAVCVCMS